MSTTWGHAVAIAALLSSILTGARVVIGAPATKPASSDNPLAQRVQLILGIEAGESNILDPLARAIAAYPDRFQVSKRDTFDQAVESLIDAVLRGAPPDALSSLILSHTHITARPVASANTTTWSYGGSVDQNRLTMEIWKQAQELTKTDRGRASRRARAALLLAAHQDFTVGTGIITALLREGQEFPGIANLTEVQAADLRKLRVELQSEYEARTPVASSTMKATDALIVDPQSRMSGERVDQVLAGLLTWKQVVSKQSDLTGHFDLIWEAWELKNLALARNDPNAVQAVNAFFEKWLEETPRQPISRWLREALDNKGPPPKEPRVRVLQEGDPLLDELRGGKPPPVLGEGRKFHPLLLVGLLIIAVMCIVAIVQRRRRQPKPRE
ncbi:MAG: hypothetical protein WBD40_22855 [Tepidisphaeraceae bacterium]